jgi:hypothetical protein
MSDTLSKHEDTSSTTPSPEQIIGILKKHPGVKDAHIYSVQLPEDGDAFMAAIITNSRYDKWPGTSRWDRTMDHEPRDYDDAFTARLCQYEDEINMIFSDVCNDLPPKYAPAFVRTVPEEKLVTSNKVAIEREGWDYDYKFQ